MVEEGPEIKAIEGVTSPAIFGLCLAGAIFVLCVAAVTCYCYRLRRLHNAKRHGPDQPLAFHTHRRPTAVKSPAGGTTTHYLKKSPSPTNPSRTPPSMSGPNTPSPTGNAGAALENTANGNERVESPAVRDVYTSETETTHTPSKEEIETNEKNLQHSASYLGQLVFKLRYKHDKNALIVSVVRCRDLPAKDPNLGSSDPYVKLQLLPDKQHKVKTRVLRKTRNPVYDEDFTFYGINFNQLPSITLHFVVLSFDRYSRDDIIGEVFCALNTVDINQAENQQIALCREIQPRSLKIRSQGRGELLVSLCWQPAANRLTVVVLKARNLPKMDVTGLADPYVKMYLLYNGQRIAKKKTHVKKRTLSPVFNESFVFDIPAGGEGLDNVNLEFLLLDWDRVTKNEVIGRLELGGPKCTGSALHHWNEVCNSPRRQIADWHKLQRKTFTIEESKEIHVPIKKQLSLNIKYRAPAPPPAPLVVEDPPSSDASDLEDLKHHTDPSHLDGSSSNFGSAGARSAPSTPQGLLGSSPGGLSCDPSSQPCSPPAFTAIQRSPSHTVFTKYDKGTLKQLSSSTPAMTAQARSPEPPSPKAIAKEDKLPTTSKARQKKFLRHFPAVDLEEKVLNYYSCALIGDILLQGHLYITKNYFAFYSNVFGYVTKLLIPLLSVEKITKEKTARIIPNAVGIATTEDKHVFGSLISRDNTYRLMNKVWDAARNNALPVETELLATNAASECSDSSKSSESDNELTAPDTASVTEATETSTRIRRIPPITPAQVLKSEHSSKATSDAEGRSVSGISTTLRLRYTKLTNLPPQTLVLYASTLLLLLLFLSAAVLLYRIGKVQQKYILALQDNHVTSNSEDVYGELLQWQAQLHSKSAGAVHNFLDSNLDQLAKVRQSLEALSTLLMVSESSNNNNSANRNAATEHIQPSETS